MNSSNDDKGWGWAAGRRRRNVAWIWISQHLNGTSRKRCPCAKWPPEQVWFTKSALLNVYGNVEKSLRNILPIFLLLPARWWPDTLPEFESGGRWQRPHKQVKRRQCKCSFVENPSFKSSKYHSLLYPILVRRNRHLSRYSVCLSY